MPEAPRPAVIAANLGDATRFTAHLGGDWSRILVGRDKPADVAWLGPPAVIITPAAMAAGATRVHELVGALAASNPDLEVHLPPRQLPVQMEPDRPVRPPIRPLDGTPRQDDIDRTREELTRDTDELLARRLLRRLQDRASDATDAMTTFLENVPTSRRVNAAREAGRRRVRTGMSAGDALRSVAADYTAGRLS